MKQLWFLPVASKSGTSTPRPLTHEPISRSTSFVRTLTPLLYVGSLAGVPDKRVSCR